MTKKMPEIGYLYEEKVDDEINKKNLLRNEETHYLVYGEREKSCESREKTLMNTELSLSYHNFFDGGDNEVTKEFRRNSQILSSRYELFHLCIAEIIYSSKNNNLISIQTLKKVSKIHEQLFKTGLKNIHNSINQGLNLNDILSLEYDKSSKNIEGRNIEDIKCDLPESYLTKFSKKISQKKTNSYFLFTWSIYNFFPVLTWFPQYDFKKYFKNDLVAGITVGVMLIAQGMAYAKLAGLSPEYGLYSSGIPLFIYPLFGTSRHLGIGPVALVSLLVSQVTLSTNNAGHDYSANEKTAFALLMAFSAGFVQILMGLFHIGFIINFISHPVIAGFTTAAAFVIILSQLQHILGYSVPKSHYPFLTLYNYIANFKKFKWQPFLFGCTNILFMQIIKQLNRMYKLEIPGPIVCVFGSIVLTQIMRLDRFGITIQNKIPRGFPKLRGPIFNEFTKVAPTVLTISFINFLETVAIASKIGEVHGYKIVPDQELIGSGMTNLIGSFLCAFPMAGSFSRTAVLSQLGAKTQVAGIVTGLVIVLTYLFLTPLFKFLPNVTLASIILVSVVNLIDYNEAAHLLRIRFLDFFAFTISLISTFMIGVEWGMAIAVGVSLIFVLWFSVKPPICTLGRIRGTVVYRDIEWYEKCIRTPGGLLLRMDAPLFFVNAAVLRKKVRQKEEEYQDKNPVPLFYVILDCRGMTDIDSTGLQVLNELAEKYDKQGVFLGFANTNERVKNLIQMGKKITTLKEGRFFARIHDGIESAIRWKFFHTKYSSDII
jgi:sulfate transporter 4